MRALKCLDGKSYIESKTLNEEQKAITIAGFGTIMKI